MVCVVICRANVHSFLGDVLIISRYKYILQMKEEGGARGRKREI